MQSVQFVYHPVWHTNGSLKGGWGQSPLGVTSVYLTMSGNDCTMSGYFSGQWSPPKVVWFTETSLKQAEKFADVLTRMFWSSS